MEKNPNRVNHPISHLRFRTFLILGSKYAALRASACIRVAAVVYMLLMALTHALRQHVQIHMNTILTLYNHGPACCISVGCISRQRLQEQAAESGPEPQQLCSRPKLWTLVHGQWQTTTPTSILVSYYESYSGTTLRPLQ